MILTQHTGITHSLFEDNGKENCPSCKLEVCKKYVIKEEQNKQNKQSTITHKAVCKFPSLSMRRICAILLYAWKLQHLQQ